MLALLINKPELSTPPSEVATIGLGLMPLILHQQQINRFSKNHGVINCDSLAITQEIQENACLFLPGNPGKVSRIFAKTDMAPRNELGTLLYMLSSDFAKKLELEEIFFFAYERDLYSTWGPTTVYWS